MFYRNTTKFLTMLHSKELGSLYNDAKQLGFIIKFLMNNRFYIKQMYMFFKCEERAILNINKYGDNRNLYVKTETRHPPEVIDKISPGVKEDNTKFADEIVKEIIKSNEEIKD